MRLARRLIVTALILGTLFYGVDLVAKRVAASRVAEQAKTSFRTKSMPSVSIGGFPFLLDLLNGRIASLRIAGDGAVDQDLTIEHLEITLKGVRASLSAIAAGKAIGIDSGLAVATVSGAEIDRYVHDRNPRVRVRVRRDGVVVTGRVPGGEGAAEGRPKLVGRLLTFTPDRVSRNGAPLKGAALEAAKRALSFEVDLPILPGGVRITGIEYDDGNARLIARLSNATIDLGKSPS